MSDLLTQMEAQTHEEVVFFQDKSVGLKAIVAIHDTTLGPSLGGTRMYPYASENEALYDVLRLSRGMTYKAAISGLKLGGGKAVIIGDPSAKTRELFRAYGRFVETLGGRYITAEDSGTRVEDMETIHQETQFVTGIEPKHGGSGNPAPFTALGVFCAMQAALERVYGNAEFRSRVVVLQGVGQVGGYLLEHLTRAGAKIFASDINQDRLFERQRRFGFEIVPEEKLFSIPCDIFSPCALGAVLNEKTIPELQCKMVVGAANNQLARLEDADRLRARGILYAPDYVVNAGGLINVYQELEGYDVNRARQKTLEIHQTLQQVFALAEQENISTATAADRLVEERLQQARTTAPRFHEKRGTVFEKRQHRANQASFR